MKIEKAQIELTDKQANQLLELLDIAVKSQGITLASNALFFVQKISEAFTPKPVPVSKPEEVKEAS